jgi:hypothetical protein
MWSVVRRAELFDRARAHARVRAHAPARTGAGARDCMHARTLRHARTHARPYTHRHRRMRVQMHPRAHGFCGWQELLDQRVGHWIRVPAGACVLLAGHTLEAATVPSPSPIEYPPRVPCDQTDSTGGETTEKFLGAFDRRALATSRCDLRIVRFFARKAAAMCREARSSHAVTGSCPPAALASTAASHSASRCARGPAPCSTGHSCPRRSGGVSPCRSARRSQRFWPISTSAQNRPHCHPAATDPSQRLRRPRKLPKSLVTSRRARRGHIRTRTGRHLR